MNALNGIEKWFSGKALAVIQTYVLPTLALAASQGYWPKGASRKVTAALNKQTVAQKFARANERSYNHKRNGDDAGLLSDVMDKRATWYEAELRGGEFVHAMLFGLFGHAPSLVELGAKLAPLCQTDSERKALATAREWAADFAPVAELVKTLDARKPVPTVVFKTLSPTVVANVGKSMGVDLSNVRMPPMKITWEKRTVKGREVEVAVAEIEWPAGTRHGSSRFAHGTAHNFQCHACGHAIKNAYNWVPLLGDTPAGPVSLWVGHDCAKKLFDAVVEGEADFTEAMKVSV